MTELWTDVGVMHGERIPCILRRIHAGQALRTSVIEGFTVKHPTVGEPFFMNAEGLEFGTRVVNTSPVKEVHGAGFFLTESGSIYHLQILTRETSNAPPN